MEERIRSKVACDKAAYDIQWLLLEPGVRTEALEAAANVLQPAHYDDIVSERALDGLCGYPPCSDEAPKRGQGRKLHVSLSEHKVYDISGLHNFCGKDCAEKSKLYAATLNPTALFLRTGTAAPAHAAMAAVKAAIASESRAAAPAEVDLSDPVRAEPADQADAATSEMAPRAKPAAFGEGATLGPVRERDATAAPNLNFPQPASVTAIEGYQARLDGRERADMAAVMAAEQMLRSCGQAAAAAVKQEPVGTAASGRGQS